MPGLEQHNRIEKMKLFQFIFCCRPWALVWTYNQNPGPACCHDDFQSIYISGTQFMAFKDTALLSH